MKSTEIQQLAINVNTLNQLLAWDLYLLQLKSLHRTATIKVQINSLGVSGRLAPELYITPEAIEPFLRNHLQEIVASLNKSGINCDEQIQEYLAEASKYQNKDDQ